MLILTIMVATSHISLSLNEFKLNKIEYLVPVPLAIFQMLNSYRWQHRRATVPFVESSRSIYREINLSLAEVTAFLKIGDKCVIMPDNCLPTRVRQGRNKEEVRMRKIQP